MFDPLDCKKCDLYKTRMQVVPSSGNAKSPLYLLGEAPGRNEDLQGKPFVGRAGNLLDRILKSIDLDREQIYILNAVKCRPPKNRNPTQLEIETCGNWLYRELIANFPQTIVTMGRVAWKSLMGIDKNIKDLTGIYQYLGINVIPTYHPAAILRNPELENRFKYDLERAKNTIVYK